MEKNIVISGVFINIFFISVNNKYAQIIKIGGKMMEKDFKNCNDVNDCSCSKNNLEMAEEFDATNNKNANLNKNKNKNRKKIKKNKNGNL